MLFFLEHCGIQITMKLIRNKKFNLATLKSAYYTKRDKDIIKLIQFFLNYKFLGSNKNMPYKYLISPFIFF